MTGPFLYLVGVGVLLVVFVWVGDTLTERTGR